MKIGCSELLLDSLSRKKELVRADGEERGLSRQRRRFALPALVVAEGGRRDAGARSRKGVLAPFDPWWKEGLSVLQAMKIR